VVDQHSFNVVGGKESVEVAASACHRNAMSQFDLGACEIDGRVNVPVQAVRMIQ
jgi:hypothetical protein